MQDPFLSITKKIALVISAYEERSVFREIYKISGCAANELKRISVWADAVRDSRNAIHFGAAPAMENTYDKIAALLIGAVPSIKAIYSIIEACHAENA